MADPDDEDLANLYANRMRAMKSDIHERGEVDLYWEDAALSGKHKKSTYVQQSSDPTVGADEIALYTKDDGSNCELYMKNETPVVRKLTEGGELILDDHSATDAEQASSTDPGDSDTQVNPTDMGGEVETLRYAIQRAGIGIRTQLTTAAAEAGWFDGAVVSEHNEIENGGFLDGQVDPPQGWAAASTTPDTLELAILDRSEGVGKYWHIVDTTGAITDGLSQTVTGLKKDTIYLVVARIKKTTGEVRLSTTGAAAGTFTDLDFDTGDIGGGLGAGYHTLSGLIKTDSSGTDIDININPDVTNYDFGVSFVGMYEVITDYRGRAREGIVVRKTSTSTNPSVIDTDLTTDPIVCPGHGYIMEARASICGYAPNTIGGWARWAIRYTVDGGDWNSLCMVAGSEHFDDQYAVVTGFGSVRVAAGSVYLVDMDFISSSNWIYANPNGPHSLEVSMRKM
jgi:hypothetical protein